MSPRREKEKIRRKKDNLLSLISFAKVAAAALLGKSAFFLSVATKEDYCRTLL